MTDVSSRDESIFLDSVGTLKNYFIIVSIQNQNDTSVVGTIAKSDGLYVWNAAELKRPIKFILLHDLYFRYIHPLDSKIRLDRCPK